MAAISVDGDAFREFQRDLKRLDPEGAKALNKALKDVVTTKVMPSAKSNASWSSRIPGAIKPSVTAKGMGLRVAGKQAPHGRPFEGLQNGLRSRSHFRHPVFGNREVWVNQATRPYLGPAFLANHDAAVKAAQEELGKAAAQIGFR
jgi:hypothetical protein